MKLVNKCHFWISFENVWEYLHCDNLVDASVVAQRLRQFEKGDYGDAVSACGADHAHLSV